MLRPDEDYCAPCHEAIKRLLFGVGCAACKLDYWARRVNRGQRARGRPKCADCGGALQLLTPAKWVARMAGIRKLQCNSDNMYSACEQHAGRRIQQRQWPRR